MKADDEIFRFLEFDDFWNEEKRFPQKNWQNNRRTNTLLYSHETLENVAQIILDATLGTWTIYIELKEGYVLKIRYKSISSWKLKIFHSGFFVHACQSQSLCLFTICKHYLRLIGNYSKFSVLSDIQKVSQNEPYVAIPTFWKQNLHF